MIIWGPANRCSSAFPHNSLTARFTEQLSDPPVLIPLTIDT